MATITASAGGGNWSATGTWTGGVVPTSSDDVVLASTSGNVTIDVNSVCRSLDCQATGNYAGTLTWVTGATVYLTVGAATVNPSGVAFRLSTGMTLSTAGNAALLLYQNNATQSTLTFAGKSSAISVTIGTAALIPNYRLVDSMTTTGLVTLVSGTFDTNGQTCVWGGFIGTGTNTRTLTLGASNITSTGAGVTGWWISTATGMTVNAGTSSITLSGAAVQFCAGFAWYDVAFTGTGVPFIGRTGTTFRNLTRVGTAANTDGFGLLADATVTNSLTLTGNSAGGSVVVKTLTSTLTDNVGVTQTLTVNGSVNLYNVDFQDITTAGAGWANTYKAPLVNQTPNPSFETSAAVWASFAVQGTISNIAQVADASCTYGTKAGEVTITDAVAGPLWIYQDPLAGRNVIAGERLGTRVRGKIDRIAAGSVVNMYAAYRVTASNGNYVGTYYAGGPVVTSPVTGTWYEFVEYIDSSAVLATFPGAYCVTVALVSNYSANTSGLAMRLDAAMLYKMPTGSTTVLPYFDGDTPGFKWDGPVDTSTSSFVSRAIGNGLGNSGLDDLFDPPRTLYARGASSFTNPALFSLTSGGVSADTYSRPQDDLVFDSNSPNGTYTINVPRPGRNLTVLPGFIGTLTNQTTWSLYGSLTLNSTMTVAGTNTLQMRGRGNHAITTAGRKLTFTTQMYNVGGSVTLTDNYDSTSSFQPFYGTFDTAGFNMNLSTFVSNVAGVRNFLFRTSTITVAGTSNVWFFSAGTLTVDASQATVNVAGTTSTSKLLNMTNYLGTLGTVNFTGAGTLSLSANTTYGTFNAPGPSQIIAPLTTNVTFGSLNLGPGVQILGPAGATTAGRYSGNGARNPYVYLSGNGYASAPDSAPLQITGDIDVRAKVALDTWVTTGSSVLVGRGIASGYRLYVGAGKVLIFRFSLNGTTETITSSSAPFTDPGNGVPMWVRATREASTGNVKFYTSADGTAWTQVGSTISAASGSIVPGANNVGLGVDSSYATNFMQGGFYRAQIRNNILDDGSGIVFDADFTTKAFGADSFTDGKGNTITLNGPAVTGDGRIDIRSTTPGTPSPLKMPSGITALSNYRMTDSSVSPTDGNPSIFFAGSNSYDGGNNAGWVFADPPPVADLPTAAFVQTIKLEATVVPHRKTDAQLGRPKTSAAVSY